MTQTTPTPSPRRRVLEELRGVRAVLLRVRDGGVQVPRNQAAEWVALLPHVEEVLELAESSDDRFDELAERNPTRAAQIEAVVERMYLHLRLEGAIQ